MEVVVGVAIGVLIVIFIAAFVGLVFLLRYKCKNEDLISQEHKKESRPDAQLIEESVEVPNPEMGVELGTVQITSPQLEEVLNNDEELADDTSGLYPTCLAILKSCHLLLVGLTRETANNVLTQETVTEINSAAKRINPRVNDVVQSMNSTLDPRLLEARFTTLVLSVSHLVMITKKAYRMPGTLDWIDQSLADMEDHLRVLREASENLDSQAQGTAGTVEQHAQQNGGMARNYNSQL